LHLQAYIQRPDRAWPDLHYDRWCLAGGSSAP